RSPVLFESWRISSVISALIMSSLWALWHAPAFFFPGMPQAFISPLGFLGAVVAFGVFLGLIFNKTKGASLGACWHILHSTLPWLLEEPSPATFCGGVSQEFYPCWLAGVLLCSHTLRAASTRNQSEV